MSKLAEISKNLEELRAELYAVNQHLSEIQGTIDSWTLSIWELVGRTNENLEDEIAIMKADIKDLSREDLERRRQLVDSNRRVLEIEISELEVAYNKQLNVESPDKFKQEDQERRARINKELDTQAAAARQELFKQQVSEQTNNLAGAGMVSMIAPVTGFVGAAAVVGKAGYETYYASDPLAKERTLLDSMDAFDYEFLKENDRIQGVNDSVQLEDVQLASLTGDIQDAANEKIEQVKDQAQEKIDEIQQGIEEHVEKTKQQVRARAERIRSAFEKAGKVFLGIPTWTGIVWGAAALVTLAAGAAVPPLWPLYAAVGIAAVAAVTFGIVKVAVIPTAPAHKVIDKIIDVIYAPARPIVKMAVTLTVSPIKNMIKLGESKRDPELYAIIGVSAVLGLAAGFGLAAAAPALGIGAATAAVVGTLAGAFAGLNLGNAYENVRVWRRKRKDARKNKRKSTKVQPDNNPAQEIKPEPAQKKQVKISAEALQALDKVDKGLATELAKHFVSRAEALQEQIKQPNADQSEIASRLDVLEADWNSMVMASEQPDLFVDVVNAYLDKEYRQARTRYIDTVQARKKTMTFQGVNYSAERKEIKELGELRSRVRSIRRPQ